jgi:hypothetical protein
LENKDEIWMQQLERKDARVIAQYSRHTAIMHAAIVNVVIITAPIYTHTHSHTLAHARTLLHTHGCRWPRSGSWSETSQWLWSFSLLVWIPLLPSALRIPHFWSLQTWRDTKRWNITLLCHPKLGTRLMLSLACVVACEWVWSPDCLYRSDTPYQADKDREAAAQNLASVQEHHDAEVPFFLHLS